MMKPRSKTCTERDRDTKTSSAGFAGSSSNRFWWGDESEFACHGASILFFDLRLSHKHNSSDVYENKHGPNNNEQRGAINRLNSDVGRALVRKLRAFWR